MRRSIGLAILIIVTGSSLAMGQTPEIVYEWAGVPSTTKDWQVIDRAVLGPVGSPNCPSGCTTATMSAATGDLVVTETGNGVFGTVGGSFWVRDLYNVPREGWLEQGNLDVTGLQYLEIDLQHNHPSGIVDVNFWLHIYKDHNGNPPDELASYSGGSDGLLYGAPWHVGPGLNTIRFPISQLTRREQSSIASIIVIPAAHTALGNLTWTIRQVRTTGTPLTYRDIVTNNAGSPDDGIDGAFPLNTADMAAIAGNTGTVSQLGFSRNPAGSGSLQWTDLGDHGDPNNVSGATIGWGNGFGWRNVQPGHPTLVSDPTKGNSYWERIANFSGYDRMTVRISANDAVNPAGTVGIEGVFAMCDPAGSTYCQSPPPPTILPSQDLPTDGQYHDLVYDLSSISFLKSVWHWGIDVASHPNDIVFNVDNIRLWNSKTPAGVAGDYNGNGTVDAADYVLWRNGGTLQNEGVTPGSNTPEDYTYWRSRFGATSGSGTAVAAAVPETNTIASLILALFGILWKRRGVAVGLSW